MTMSNESANLDELLAAIVADEDRAVRLVRATPGSPAQQSAVIELLLNAGADIERTLTSGAAPLHRAVRARSPEAVRCLLERGARVDATHGQQHTTSLHIAAHSTGASGTKGSRDERQEIVRLLLEFGADSRARDAKRSMPRI
jgi:ankyrin repeat protein